MSLCGADTSTETRVVHNRREARELTICWGWNLMEFPTIKVRAEYRYSASINHKGRIDGSDRRELVGHQENCSIKDNLECDCFYRRPVIVLRNYGRLYTCWWHAPLGFWPRVRWAAIDNNT